jgi:hypothetical protein
LRGGCGESSLLFESAAYGPDTLKILYKAFDGAWEQIAPDVSSRAEAIEVARNRLAGVVLSLASNGAVDAEKLTEDAVQLMYANHTRLRPRP